MDGDLVKRIKFIIDSSGLSSLSFAKKINVNPQTLYKCINGRIPSVELLYNILETFPDISSEWLLMGRGNIKKEDVNFLKKQIQIKDDQIQKLIEKLSH